MTTRVIALTQLVGRDADLARLRSLLASPEVRLVTLFGPGGIGKTRLSLALLDSVASADRTGIFCDLSSARTRDDVLHLLGRAVAAADPSPTSSAIAAQLADTPTWLVLDNAEQVAAETAALTSELLRDVPSLGCIVTSRERLRTDGEVTYPVTTLAAEDAVALFVARAEATGATGPFDHARVRRLVDRVDRIPLAIELAAGHMSVLSLEELEDHLEQRLLGLAAARRDVPDRQVTMRATLEWSWALLDDAGRDAIAALSVFESSFPLSGAEHVLASPDALARLRELCDRSWLQRHQRGGVSRFAMLQIVRELAREALSERDDRATVRARHADWVLGEADRSLARLTGARELASVAGLAGDLRAIAERSAEPERSLRAAIGFGRLATHRGPVRIALGLLDAALGRDAPSSTLLWHAAHTRARLLLRDGRADAARAALRECLADPVTPSLRAEALATLGSIQRREGELAQAEDSYRAALEISEGRDDAVARARMLGELGALAYERGELDEAEALHRRALAAHRDAGSRLHEGVVLSNLGLILRERGRWAEAEASFEDALAAHRAAAHGRFVGIALADLAALYLERGALPAALRHGEDALAALRTAGDRSQLALTRALVGAVHAAMGELGRSESMMDEAEAALATIGDASYSVAARAYRGLLHVARALGATRREEVDAAAAELERARACQPGPARARHDEARHAGRTLAAAIARLESIDRALLVTADASWLRGPGSEPADIGRRKILGALLGALVGRRQASPGDPLTTEELVAAGWPGERMLPRAATNRVRVALSELRKLGLGDLLRRQTHGYYLDPDVPLIVVPSGD